MTIRRGNDVTDDIWNEAAKHDNEKQLAALLSMIGLTNLFNRFNAVTKQIAGAAW
jgi:alkylhydroperoxidase family enzyme